MKKLITLFKKTAPPNLSIADCIEAKTLEVSMWLDKMEARVQERKASSPAEEGLNVLYPNAAVKYYSWLRESGKEDSPESLTEWSQEAFN
jgi:hypothetical protein